MSNRDPFPFPKLENDLTLSGFRPQQRETCKKTGQITQKEEPWSHLHDAATQASTRRNVTYLEPQIPNDSLDFQMTTIYDHHKDAFCTKHQMLYQRENLCEHQRKREMLKKMMLEKEQEAEMKVWVDPKRTSIHSIK